MDKELKITLPNGDVWTIKKFNTNGNYKYILYFDTLEHIKAERLSHTAIHGIYATIEECLGHLKENHFLRF